MAFLVLSSSVDIFFKKRKFPQVDDG